jgi:hypothetical protein
MLFSVYIFIKMLWSDDGEGGDGGCIMERKWSSMRVAALV